MRTDIPMQRGPGWLPTRSHVYRATLLVAASTAVVATVLIGMTAGGWVGQSFPGFFVLSNRIIPSIGRETWPVNSDGTVYQRTVVAIDGKPIKDNVDAYRDVAARPAGTAVEYTLRSAGGTATVRIPSRRFSAVDYWIIFGSYLATGLLYILVGMLAVWLSPDASLGRALLLLGGTGGIFALTGANIYQPGADLRIHILAESFFPATLVYLALVVRRTERRTLLMLAAMACWLSLGLAITYQLMLGQPDAYTLIHNACEAYMGLAGLGVGVTLIAQRARAADAAGPLLRAAVAGALLGIGVPAVIMILSALSGGALPVNFVTATAFLFPLCLGYGVLREHTLVARPTAPA